MENILCQHQERRSKKAPHKRIDCNRTVSMHEGHVDDIDHTCHEDQHDAWFETDPREDMRGCVVRGMRRPRGAEKAGGEK